MVYSLGKNAWNGLKQSLELAHQALNPPAYARSAVRGWINAYGPAFEGTWTAVEQVLQTADLYGFRELATPEELYKDWQSSYERWKDRKAL